VRLCVYNLKGQKVAELFSGNLPAGEHRKVWNGRDYHGRSVSSGIYLIRLEAESATFTRKIMLMK
jgi:flagellar hook assembly protein FlgD